MKKIITHDGLFHADEVLAIALIKEIYGDISVERTRNISTEDFDNPEIWIVDVGGVYNPELSCFDHHHDASLDASCMIVLEHLLTIDKVSNELFLELQNSFKVVSDIDKGGPSMYSGFQFNTLIKMMNPLENGFYIALDICKNVIKSCIDNVENIEKSLRIWNEGEQISMYIKYCTEFPIHWKRYEDSSVSYLIYPNKGKFNVLSINSNEFPIYSTGEEEFLHNGKFLAVFSSKEAAIRCAQMSMYNIVG